MAVTASGGSGSGLAFTWDGARVGRLGQDIVEAVCQTLGDRALAYMRTIVPVDTGFLRDSTFVEIMRQGASVLVTVGAEASYAIFVELGSAFSEAQPFIRPAFDFIVSQLPQVLHAEATARGFR